MYDPLDKEPGKPIDSASVIAAPSEIDGLGAFAVKSLPKRKKIGEMDGERISVRTARRRAKSAGPLFLVELDGRRAIDGASSRSALKHVNHSCDPNVFLRVAFGRLEFYALRTIQAGEELTANYGPTHHDGRLPCRCRSANCAGFI